jgi:23S rRNA (guanosine2251-2'-O)-methyltransferase
LSRKRGRHAPGDDGPPTFIYGVQPVLEALLGGASVRAVRVARAEGGRTQDILQAAKDAGVPIMDVAKDDLTRRVGSASHQGVLAELDPKVLESVDVDAIVDRAEAMGEEPLVVLLDGIQDPQNLGAILRSVYALGAHGVVLPTNRAAKVTAAVVRASAGAALIVPIAYVTNLKLAMDRLVDRGVWTAAAVMEGEPVHRAKLTGPLALVIGGEGAGVKPTLAEKCDLRVAIPLSHGFDSLNASVAAGILLWEALRQRLDSAARVL